MSEAKRVTLRGGLPHTASWASIDDDGALVVELYDFSPDAHRWLGNDVAFLLRLEPGAKAGVLRRLAANPQSAAADPDGLLLRLVRERFADYYAVRGWLDAQDIAYSKEFDPWA